MVIVSNGENILVIGDSFSADWTIKYPDSKGWPILLADKFKITNLSLAGCSEYKIRQQLNSVDILQFTHCIVCHTSPNRIPVEVHPLHSSDPLHHSCDLIYADIENSKDPAVSSIKEYFKKYFHNEFYEYVHHLIIKDLYETLSIQSLKTLHITFFDYDNEYLNKNYFQLFKKNSGLINHLDDFGNQTVFDEIDDWII